MKLSKPGTFSVEDVARNDDLVRLYTRFTMYSVFLAFYEFLGPSVNELTYRSRQSSQPAQKRHQEIAESFEPTFFEIEAQFA